MTTVASSSGTLARKIKDSLVASAGNIVNLARTCRGMIGRLVSVKENHSLFTKRDQQMIEIPIFKQFVADN